MVKHYVASILSPLLLSLTHVSCSTGSTLYDWGSYNHSLDRVFNSQQQFLVNDEIEILAGELEQTLPNRVPPGKTAHLGYLYATKGDTSTAKELFKQEKGLFPESATFMDKLIKMLAEKKLDVNSK